MTRMSQAKNPRVLGVFALAMINVAAIVSLRNFPLMAKEGCTSLFFYFVAGFIFLIPTALVCAELASGWPQRGGVYRWVREAFGPKVALMSIWWAWMEGIAWFPAILTFLGTIIAYLIDPLLAKNKAYMLTVMLSIFWGGTFINFLGMRTSALITTLGVVLGTLLPGLFIIACAAWWLWSGQINHLSMDYNTLLPEWHLNQLVFFTGVLLGFSGMEVSAFHAQEAKDPQRDYPKAILLATGIILSLSIIGSLSIAIMVPAEEVNLVEGLLQTIRQFFRAFGLEAWVPVFAVFIVIGSLAGVNTWIIGPPKGVLAAGLDGGIPPWLQKVNAEQVPVAALLLQAVIGTVLASAILLMPSIETAFWIMTVLAAQFALLMYSILFAAAVVLRYRQPHVPRAFKIPGGNWGISLIALIGITGALFAIGLGFVPPAQLEEGKLWIYETYLIVGLGLFSVPPFLCCKYQKPHWINQGLQLE